MRNRPTSQPTLYNGRTYRSRTEARWAYFFDVMRLPVEYEPDGFQLAGGRYLPDFYVPCLKERNVNSTWVEVKGQQPTPEEKAKLMEVCAAYGCEGLILIGEPRANGSLFYFDPANKANTPDGWRIASQTYLYQLLGANEGTFKAAWFESVNTYFKSVPFAPPRIGRYFINVRDVDELKRNAEAVSIYKKKLSDTQIWLGAALIACGVLLLILVLR